MILAPHWLWGKVRFRDSLTTLLVGVREPSKKLDFELEVVSKAYQLLVIWTVIKSVLKLNTENVLQPFDGDLYIWNIMVQKWAYTLIFCTYILILIHFYCLVLRSVASFKLEIRN